MLNNPNCLKKSRRWQPQCCSLAYSLGCSLLYHFLEFAYWVTKILREYKVLLQQQHIVYLKMIKSKIFILIIIYNACCDYLSQYSIFPSSKFCLKVPLIYTLGTALSKCKLIVLNWFFWELSNCQIEQRNNNHGTLIYVIHWLGGPYWVKLCPRSWVWPSCFIWKQIHCELKL